jgi:hypothetical protein
MNLVKLLTVGRSLNGGKPVSGNYKLQQISLPKFSSTVRPSKAAAAKASSIISTKAAPLVPAQVLVAPTPVRVVETVKPVTDRLESAPCGMDKTQKIPAGKILKRKESAKISFQFKFVTWLQTKTASWKKRLFPIRSKKKAGAIPTQAEWNLEKVTVARNDLSEADLEIVTPKIATKTEPRKTHLPDLGRVKNSGIAWVKKTTSLFKTSSPFEVGAKANPTAVAEENRRELAERI